MLLLLLLAAGVALRLHRLADRSFYDEAASWTFAHLSWGNFWHVIWNYEGNMAFYYLLLHGWSVFGDSEVAIRSLSVVFGAATIPAIYWLGSYLFNRKAGLISALLLAVHAFHIQFSQEARGYALVTLVLVLSTYFFARAVQSPDDKKIWAGYVVLSAIAVYSQLFAVLVLAAQWLSLGVSEFKKIGISTVAIVIPTIVCLISPMIAFVLFQNKGQLSWVKPLTVETFFSFAKLFAGGKDSLLAIYLTLCLCAVLPISKKIASRQTQRLLILWLGFPIITTILVSLVTPIFVDRLFLMCVPALILLASAGLVKLSQISPFSRLVSLGLLVSIVVLSILSNRTIWHTVVPSQDTFQQMAKYVLVHQQPNDVAFIFPAATSLSFDYYMHRLSHNIPHAAIPTTVFPDFGETPSGAQPAPTKADVEAAMKEHERVWLILDRRSIKPLPERIRTVRMIRLTFIENSWKPKARQSFPAHLTATLYTKDGQ